MINFFKKNFAKGKKSLRICHPEIVSGSYHQQKCSANRTQKSNFRQVCTNYFDFNTISYASRKATRHVIGDLVPAFTLDEVFSPYYLSPRRAAFTLAEVLITLGIIGVVAALTLPGLITEYRHKALETGLARFYSLINQALNASTIDNGDPKYWNYTDNSCEFYKTYLAKYLKTTKYECGYYNEKSKVNDERFVGIYFPSGDMAVFSYGRVFVYLRKTPKFYRAYAALMSSNPDDKEELYGRELFAFELRNANSDGYGNPDRYRHESRKYGVEPFDGLSIYSNEQILQRCIRYPSRCVEVIRRNGWKIPDNYPYKIK